MAVTVVTTCYWSSRAATGRGLDRHVSAEEVLTAANEDLTNISLPTVYSTLEPFEHQNCLSSAINAR